MMQGCLVDTISSDIHAISINTPGYPTMPWVMSKFIAMGLRWTRLSPRDRRTGPLVGRVPGLGTLTVGAPADVAIFDFVEGPVEFVDTRQQRSRVRRSSFRCSREGGRTVRPALPHSVPVLIACSMQGRRARARGSDVAAIAAAEWC